MGNRKVLVQTKRRNQFQISEMRSVRNSVKMKEYFLVHLCEVEKINQKEVGPSERIVSHTPNEASMNR